MPSCGPSNAIPSCSAIPSVGFGSDSSSFGSGFGYGGSALGSLGSGATVSAASLGVLQGVQPAPINQLPPSQCVIQPPPSVITIPGAILSATPQPVLVGGYSPCAAPGSGSGLGFGNICIGGPFYGRGSFLGRSSSVCQ